MHTLYTQSLSILVTRLLLSYILEYTHYILSISVTLNPQCLSIRDWLFLFSDCSCDWQMGGKKKGRVTRHATRAQPAHEGSDAEESESGALSGTSSEKQRLFETRAQLREAQQESLRLAGELAEDDEADEDDDDDYDETAAQPAEDALATLRTENAALKRQLQRKTGAATKRSTWKANSLYTIPPDTPSLLEPKDILAVRDGVLQWLGVHSWALRLGKAERKLLTHKQLIIHETRYQEFCDNYTPGSLHQLHHDIYMALKRLLGKSLMVSHLFHKVTTETSNCAAAFWDLLLQTFPPSSPQVVAGLIAAAAASIMRGPDHSSMDPDKAFKHWDAAVASLLQVGGEVLTPERLGAIMMYASLHSSAKDTYYSAFMRLNESLTNGTSTFDVATVRAAAVLAFNAESRRLRKTPPDSTPTSVLGFAANVVGPRSSGRRSTLGPRWVNRGSPFFGGQPWVPAQKSSTVGPQIPADIPCHYSVVQGSTINC